jgi:lactoylglutathione lyase
VKLSQVRLLVDDFPSCFRFYRDVLGLEAGFGDESSGYASFNAGEGTIAIFDRAEQGEVVSLRPAGDGVLVVLEVDDVDAEAERLRGAGAAVEREPQSRPDWGIRVLHVRDPAGNLLELVQEIPMAS